METLNLLDVVVLTEDVPSEKLRRGAIGTVVEEFGGDSFLVEFADGRGVTYAMPLLTIHQLLKVHNEPQEA